MLWSERAAQQFLAEMSADVPRGQHRFSLVFLARSVRNWKQVLQIIQPDTLLRWHGEGYRLFWKLKSRGCVQPQPQRLAPETIAVIERMALENRLWGAERIWGE